LFHSFRNSYVRLISRRFFSTIFAVLRLIPIMETRQANAHILYPHTPVRLFPLLNFLGNLSQPATFRSSTPMVSFPTFLFFLLFSPPLGVRPLSLSVHPPPPFTSNAFLSTLAVTSSFFAGLFRPYNLHNVERPPKPPQLS